LLADPASTALSIDARVSKSLADNALPTAEFGVPLAANLIPWISSDLGDGQSREEWKGHAEGNKILGAATEVPIDGVCVRVGTMRCHAQAFTIKLNSDVPLDEVRDLISDANDWVRVIDNEKAASIASLSPSSVGGTLEVPIGRLRQMRMGPRYLSAFSVGDQLLWGAAEPLRRMLEILRHR
jgi:aspartate-semialdehyde dehydrogenase